MTKITDTFWYAVMKHVAPIGYVLDGVAFLFSTQPHTKLFSYITSGIFIGLGIVSFLSSRSLRNIRMRDQNIVTVDAGAELVIPIAEVCTYSVRPTNWGSPLVLRIKSRHGCVLETVISLVRSLGLETFLGKQAKREF